MKKDTKKEEYVYQVVYYDGSCREFCSNSLDGAILHGDIVEIKRIGKKENGKNKIYKIEKMTFSVVFETKSDDENKMSVKNYERREDEHLSSLKKAVKKLNLDKDTYVNVYLEKVERGLGF